jgi:hypothetical protein
MPISSCPTTSSRRSGRAKAGHRKIAVSWCGTQKRWCPLTDGCTTIAKKPIKILPGITKLDPKYIAKSWETYTQTQIWPRNGEVNLKGVQTVLNLIAEEGALKKPLPKPEDIVDSSYLEEARKALPR